MALENPFVSILTDFGFKKIFGDPNDMSFSQKVLQILIHPNEPIREVRIDNTHQITEEEKDRGAVYDAFYSDDNGRKYIVEMQRTEVGNFVHRVQFYTYFRLNEMVEKGGKIKYHKLRPIYSISFLDGKAYPGEEFCHIACLRNQHGELISDQITHILLELGKWNKTEAEIETDLDKLILLMKFTDTATIHDPIPEVLTKEEWTAQTLEKLRTNNLTSEERVAYKDALAKRASLDDINYRVEQKIKVAEQKAEAAEQKAEVAEQKAEVTKQKLEVAEQKNISAMLTTLKMGTLTDKDIAKIFNVEIEHVKQLRQQLDTHS